MTTPDAPAAPGSVPPSRPSVPTPAAPDRPSGLLAFTEAVPAAPPPTRRSRERDPFLDNAKYLAIILVVVGHLIEDLRDVPEAHAIYFFLYTFHMPLFIALSGYLSRNFTFSAGKARKLISGLAVPYVIFEVAYSLPRLFLDGDLEISLLDPYYLTWFLMSLFLWRLSTPVWQQLRWPLVIAVGLSLLSGMSELPDELSMNRTFGLLPFYVLGLMLTPAHLELLKRPAVRVAGAVVLAGGLALAFALHADIATEWIRWRDSNAKIGVDNLTGSAMRLAMLTAGAALLAAFLAVTPSRRTWFSGLGAATMYAYLLHGFFVKVFQVYAKEMSTPAGVVLAVLLGVAIATLLCTPPVRRLTHWAVEPDTSWAFTALRRPSKPGARG
ncbi:acyltransferase family protein [Sphaerisporangium sp. B11E5]|uniref:acyltransferase family protein n=1 Tax=Sphaerisporangium sp. B11E5 TaxID=3153563 RepID=UPI00325ECCFC